MAIERPKEAAVPAAQSQHPLQGIYILVVINRRELGPGTSIDLRNEAGVTIVGAPEETAMNHTNKAGPQERVPGDETEPGSKQSAPNVCASCGGTGEADGQPCPECAGTGTVTVIVGDA
jgi:hypothetical protein